MRARGEAPCWQASCVGGLAPAQHLGCCRNPPPPPPLRLPPCPALRACRRPTTRTRSGRRPATSARPCLASSLSTTAAACAHRGEGSGTGVGWMPQRWEARGEHGGWPAARCRCTPGGGHFPHLHSAAWAPATWRTRAKPRSAAASASCWARRSAAGWSALWAAGRRRSRWSPAAACCLATRGWRRTAKPMGGVDVAEVGGLWGRGGAYWWAGVGSRRGTGAGQGEWPRQLDGWAVRRLRSHAHNRHPPYHPTAHRSPVYRRRLGLLPPSAAQPAAHAAAPRAWRVRRCDYRRLPFQVRAGDHVVAGVMELARS